MQFVIPTEELLVSSGTPCHLKQRFNRRKISPKHSQRRNLFLIARQVRLSQRHEQLKSIVEQMREEERKSAEEMRLKLEQDLEQKEINKRIKLDEQRARNQSIVEHCKKVAKQTKARDVEDRFLLKINIDKQLKEKTERRNFLLPVPRSKLLQPHSLERICALNKQAAVLQRWFRKLKLKPLIKLLSKHKVSKTALSKFDFQTLAQRLENSQLIKIIGLFLIRAKKMAKKTVDYRSWKNPARVLLSAYMIAVHPESALQGDGTAKEEDLKNLANELVESFEIWTSASGSAKYSRSFLDRFLSYYQIFEEWKNLDFAQVIEMLINNFMQLESLWISVMNQEDALNEWAPGIEDQQNGILKRLRNFGNSAVLKLSEAQAETRAQIFLSDEVLVIDKTSLISPLAYRPQPKLKDSLTHPDNENIDVPLNEDTHKAPQAADFDEFGSYLSKEMLAHELALDANFSLKAPSKSSFEQKIMEIAKKALVDSIREEINKGELSLKVFGCLMDVKKGLLNMLDSNGSVAKKISESLDESFILHEIKHKVFDLGKTLRYIGSKMLELCAPLRDNEIKALSSINDSADVMIQMLDIIQKMQLDLSNYRLQSVRPHLMRQAVEYEREKFDEAVQKRQITLDKTAAWLKLSVQSLQSVIDSRNPEGLEHPDLKVKCDDALNHAYISLLFSKDPIGLSNVPETLLMDVKRMHGWQNELQALAIVSAICMLSRNVISCFRRDSIAMIDLKNDLLLLLKQEGTTVEMLTTQIVSVANKSMKKTSEAQSNLSKLTSKPFEAEKVQVSENELEMVRSMVDKTVSYKDPLFSLLSRRINSVISSHLEKGKFRPEVLKRHGLDVIEKELESLSTSIVTLCVHNKKVHYKHYSAVFDCLAE